MKTYDKFFGVFVVVILVGMLFGSANTIVHQSRIESYHERSAIALEKMANVPPEEHKSFKVRMAEAMARKWVGE